jgi:hypothetical protein
MPWHCIIFSGSRIFHWSLSLCLAEKKVASSQPKNVLLFMGDDMGFVQIEMTWLLGGTRGKAVSPCFQIRPRPPGIAGIGLYLGRK